MNRATQDVTAPIEEQAARYLARQEEPTWSADDQRELDAWLNDCTANEVAYLRLEYGWKRLDRLAVLQTAPAGPERNEPVHRVHWARWAGLAAGAGVLAMSSWFWQNGAFQSLIAARYSTDIGGHETVPLSDGSHIELNTDTRVRTAFSGTTRTVWIDRGEAYFDIASDPARPFVVYAGERRVTVLGTKFSVRRDADRVVVAIAEGRVRLEESDSLRSMAPKIMSGGDTAIASAMATQVQSSTPEKIARDLGWRQGVLTFDQTTLADAAAEFNRYNRKRLVIANAAASVRIGGSFEAANVAAFVRLLENGFGLKAAEDGQDIRISNR